MVFKEMLKFFLVIGFGVIGIEFVSFYKMMGVDVMVVEMMDCVLFVEDEEIFKLVIKLFKQQGMKLMIGVQVEKFDKGFNMVKVYVKDVKGKVQVVEVEKVILVIGIVGNVENFGLEVFGVKIDCGYIVNDGFG